MVSFAFSPLPEDRETSPFTSLPWNNSGLKFVVLHGFWMLWAQNMTMVVSLVAGA